MSACPEETESLITIKTSDSFSRFQKIISDLLNLIITDKSKKPLLWISDTEIKIKGYNFKKSPLVNDLFKLKFDKNVCFLKCPAYNNTKLMKTVLVQQILHAVSFIIHKDIISKGGMPIHSLFLEYKGNGILLVGRSGVGKTTGYRRIQSPFKALSDDHAFIVKKNDKYRIHPFVTISECSENSLPATRDINYSVPLKMIFFLNKSDKDGISPISKSKAAYEFYNTAILLIQFYYKDFNTNSGLNNFRAAIFNNACDIIKSVPSYRLDASLHGKFWEKIREKFDSHASNT